MLKEHSINTFSVVKILARILLVVSILISTSKGDDITCPTGTCIPKGDCPEAQVEGFTNYCSYLPLIACCPKPREDNFGQSLSGLACKSYSFDLCQGTALIAGASSKEANKYEFPYMVQVGRTNDKTEQVQFDCGGTLIHEKFVLTAAHCINVVENEDMYVRLGGYNRTDGVTIEVKKVTHFNEYNIQKNDVALLELKVEAKFDKSIMPACLPRTNGLEITNFTATGWGFISDQDTLPTNLMQIVLDQLDSSQCSEKFKEIGNIYNICARAPNGLGDVCQGDSGGPLAIRHPESCLSQVFGVVGEGKLCTLEGSKTIHARVFAYLEWIERIVFVSNEKH